MSALASKKNLNEKGTDLMNNPQTREQVLFDVAGVVNNLDAQFILDDVVQESGVLEGDGLKYETS